MRQLTSKTAIKQWREATENIARAFTKKYFKHETYGEYTFWVGGEVGDLFCVAEDFFNVDRMIEALELKATYEQLMDFYYMEIDHGTEDKPMPYNFKNFVKYGKALGE